MTKLIAALIAGGILSLIYYSHPKWYIGIGYGIGILIIAGWYLISK